MSFLRNELNHELYKVLYRFFAHAQDRVLHHEINQSEEFLEFSKLIRLFRSFMNVEPTLTNFGKGSFNDLFKSSYPTSLSGVESYLGDGRSLHLLEFFNSKSFVNFDIVDIVIL